MELHQREHRRPRHSAVLRRRKRRYRLLRGAVLALAVLAAILLLAGRGGPEPTPEEETPAPTAAPTSTPGPSPAPTPAVERPWNLRLVNAWNSIEEEYAPTLAELRNGMQVDERCYPALQEMLDDCRAQGLSPVVCSAYRTQEEQRQLYQDEVEHFLAQGHTQAEAEEEAARAVAAPGTSEHQLGLAVDIVDLDYQHLDRAQEDTDVQQWLLEHCWEYGFILRFPDGKGEFTGIIYEPWHYRYVGLEAAQEIHEAGVCLEEYLGEAGTS